MANKKCIEEFISNKKIREELLAIDDDIARQERLDSMMEEVDGKLYQAEIQKMRTNVKKKIIDDVDQDPVETAMDMISLGQVRGMIGDASFEDKVQAVHNLLLGTMPDLINMSRSTISGASRSLDSQKRIIRGVMSDNIDSLKLNADEKMMVKQLQTGMEKTRTMLNNAYGKESITHMKAYMPNFTKSGRLPIVAGELFDAHWYDDIWKLTNPARVIRRIKNKEGLPDFIQGLTTKDLFEKGANLSADEVKMLRNNPEVQKAYHKVYRALATEGKSKVNYGRTDLSEPPSAWTRGRAIEFKDGDAWIDYHNRWGVDEAKTGRVLGVGPQRSAPVFDPMNALKGVFEHASRDITAAREFGPNYQIAMTEILDHAQLRAKERGYKISKRKYKRVGDAMEHVMGNLHIEGDGLAKVIAMARVLQLFKLGKAPISAFFGDSGVAAIAGKMAGLKINKLWINQLKNFGAFSASGKGIAQLDGTRLLFGAEYAIGITKSTSRYFEGSGSEAIDKVGNVFMKATALNRWTYAYKNTFKFEMLQNMASWVGKSVDEVNKESTNFLKRYGIEDDWVAIQKAKVSDGKNVYIDPAKLDDETAQRLIAAMTGETRFAVIEPSAKSRAFLYGGTEAGSVQGEAVRSAMQFKQHGVSYTLLHLARMDKMTNKTRMGYIASTFIGLQTMGAAIIITSDAIEGKGLRDMTDPRFFIDAFVRGGGGGWLIDTLFNGLMSPGGFVAAGAGPTVGSIDRVSQWLMGSYQEILDGEVEMWGSRVPFEIIKETVGKIWYAKLAFKQATNFFLNSMDDPKYMEAMGRESQKMDERGQKYIPIIGTPSGM